MTPEQKRKGLFSLNDAGGSALTFAVERDSFDWSIVENQAGVSFNTEQRAVIADAMQYYFFWAVIKQQRPRTKDVNRRLNNIARHARELDEALSTADEAGVAAVRTLWQRDGPNMSAFRGYLRWLAIAGRGLRTEAPEGRPRKSALRSLINTLHHVWVNIGGTGLLITWDEARVTRPPG